MEFKLEGDSMANKKGSPIGTSAAKEEWDCHSVASQQADRKLTTCSQSRHEALQMETHSAESSSREDSQGVEQESAVTVMNTNHMLGCIHRSTASRSRTAITLYSALVRLHLEQNIQFWFPCCKTDADKLAKVQQTGHQDDEVAAAHKL